MLPSRASAKSSARPSMSDRNSRAGAANPRQKGGETVVNRITRKIQVSRYKVKYTEDGTEREIVFETLSGLKSGDVIRIAQTYINMYTKPDATIYVSPDIEETPQGVHLYETTLTEFLEIATPVKAKNKEE